MTGYTSRRLWPDRRHWRLRGARRRLRALWAAGSFLCVAKAGEAQVVPGAGATIGTLGADRLRLRQVLGIRPDSAVPVPNGGRAILPTIRAAWNSALPAGLNDGALWAGRGTSVTVSAGLTYAREWRGRRLDVDFAPELDVSENANFVIRPGRAMGRSSFSSPWHVGDYSADLPLRFGDQPVRTLGLGQSAVTLSSTNAAVGLSNANEWWGPALRNTLLLGNNAAGVPRLFARTAHPIRTRAGEVSGRAFIGILTESPYFDGDPSNDFRSLNGLLVTLRPALDSGLTLGVARLVIAPIASGRAALLHAVDVVTRFEAVRPLADTTTNGGFKPSTDQLFSLFARWVFPESGLEAYAEWARIELPRSLREYLETPQSTQGYTLGLQWANRQAGGAILRLQGELTYLEQTTTNRDRPPPEFYAGRAALQGFTQRGQVLGAGIGPGGSSQFLAADWVASNWQLGGWVSRVRTENDALYRTFVARDTQHDVSLATGVRAGWRLASMDVQGELGLTQRYNYLFESDYYLFGPVQALDVRNVSVGFMLSPR